MELYLEKMERVDQTDISKIQSDGLKYKALEFERIKHENPKMTQIEICKTLGTSDSTMRRIRNDLGIPSPYRNKNKTKTETKTKTKTETKSKAKTKTKKSYCKPKDVLASGYLTPGNLAPWPSSIFNSPGDEELEEVLNRGILP